MKYMHSFVIMCLMALITLPANAGTLDVLSHIKAAQFTVPSGFTVHYQNGSVNITRYGVQYDVVTGVNDGKVTYSAVAPFEDDVDMIFGTIGVDWYGHPELEANISMAGSNQVIAVMVVNMTNVISLIRKCDCDDGVTMGCITNDCNAGAACPGIGGNKCIWHKKRLNLSTQGAIIGIR